MMTRPLLMWILIALDGAALALLFVLGVNGAEPAVTHPLAGAALFLLPGLLVATLVVAQRRAPAAGARLGALTLLALPVLVVPAAVLLAGGGTGPQPAAVEAVQQRPGATDAQPLLLAIRDSRHAGAGPVRALLRAGADANERGGAGPLWFEALQPGVDPEVLELLLQQDLDLHAQDAEGRDALQVAVGHRNWAAAAALLDRGAAPEPAACGTGTDLQQEVDTLLRAAPWDAALLRLQAAAARRSS